MKSDFSRFSSFCVAIALLALVAGIAVTVEAAAQQIGARTVAAERSERPVATPFVVHEPVIERIYLPLTDTDTDSVIGEI
jgi:hypothetical protein